MKKTCGNCYHLRRTHDDLYCCMRYLYREEEPTEVCRYHSFYCSRNRCDNEAQYTYKEKHYCIDCLLDHFKVKEHVTTIYYDEKGKHLGTSEDMDKVIKNLSNEVEIL